jgi:hypothetical protein
MKALVCFLLAGAVILFSAQQFASAQVSNGARRGFTATDLDVAQQTGHRIYRINLDNAAATIQRGITGVPQELEGFFSIDNSSTGFGDLFGIAETPDGTGSPVPSNCTNLTQPAVDPNASGFQVGLTDVNFGTEAGAAWDPTTNTIYAIFSDDRNINVEGQQFPATMLVQINPGCSGHSPLVITDELYLDGLAVGGDGTLYATDARHTDSLYRFDFDLFEWVLVGSLAAEDFGEDSGLANYRGLGGNETNLYMVTEGEGIARMGRLWQVCHDTNVCGAAGQATLVGNITINGVEVPEDLEGFDIPYFPLTNEQ